MWRKLPALAVLLATSFAHAQVTSPQVGQRVVLKYKQPLKMGSVIVEPKDYRAYTVEGTDGDWLWLASGGVSGWVPKGGVIPLNEAIGFYTQEIAKNPNPWNAYLYRGFVWDLKHEYDNAIRDYSQAIQIYPWWANTYNNRGWTWHRKKEYDKAIADYNEAHPPGAEVRAGTGQSRLRLAGQEGLLQGPDRLRPGHQARPQVFPGLCRTCVALRDLPRQEVPRRQDGRRVGQACLRPEHVEGGRQARRAGRRLCRVGRLRRGGPLAGGSQQALPRSRGSEEGPHSARALQAAQAVPRGGWAGSRPGSGPATPADSSERGRWSQFPDPELARQVYAELERRISKVSSGGKDAKTDQAKISSIMDIVARKHHLKQREVRAIWRAGLAAGSEDEGQ